MKMKTHYIRSRSNPTDFHTVEIHDTFSTCTCKAYEFRNKCSHIDHILKKHYSK